MIAQLALLLLSLFALRNLWSLLIVQQLSMDQSTEYFLVRMHLPSHLQVALLDQQQLNQLGIRPVYNNGNNQPPTNFMVRRPDNSRGNISFSSDYEVNSRDGDNMSSFMNGLEQVDRQLADSIKAQVINQCPAVKYIGSTKLWPSRIEDSQGNIIWSNNKL